MSENKTKLGQEPAFAYQIELVNGKNVESIGMSKRFLTAKDILCSILSNKTTVTIENGLAVNEVAMAYAIADELLRQENL